MHSWSATTEQSHDCVKPTTASDVANARATARSRSTYRRNYIASTTTSRASATAKPTPAIADRASILVKQIVGATTTLICYNSIPLSSCYTISCCLTRKNKLFSSYFDEISAFIRIITILEGTNYATAATYKLG